MIRADSATVRQAKELLGGDRSFDNVTPAELIALAAKLEGDERRYDYARLLLEHAAARSGAVS